jgi:hypothetical protein
MINSKNLQLLIDQLKHRLNNIIQSSKILLATESFSNNFQKNSEAYFIDLSYFIHFIRLNGLLNSIIKNIKITHQINLDKLANIYIHTIDCLSSVFSPDKFNEEEFAKFDGLRLIGRNRSNESFKEYYTYISSLKKDDLNKEVISNIITKNESIIKYINSIPIKPIPSIIQYFGDNLIILNKFLSNVIYSISYNEDYLGNFNYFQYYSELEFIYYLFLPTTFINLDEKNIEIPLQTKKRLLSTRDLELIEKYNSFAERLFFHLSHSLNGNYMKNYILEKFVAYIELYQSDNVPNKNVEKFFQKEFEMFLFLHDIYPISEAQIGSGRLDILAISENNSILYELKQVGFSKTSSKKSAILKRSLGGFIQTSIYKKRLASLKNIDNNVYIIIFTKIPFCFNDSSNKIIMDDIVFNFYIINLSRISPSSDKIEQVSLNDIFK